VVLHIITKKHEQETGGRRQIQLQCYSGSSSLVRVLVSLAIAESQDLNFTFSGFRSTNLSLDGLAELTSNGLLRLTNETYNRTGHAFYPNPVTFKNSINSTAFNFSTTFVFAIIPEYATLGGHGIVFVIASVLRPGPARWVDPGPGRPGPGTGPGGGKNPLGSWSGETRSTRWVDP